jgi:hypothetical protein
MKAVSLRSRSTWTCKFSLQYEAQRALLVGVDYGRRCANIVFRRGLYGNARRARQSRHDWSSALRNTFSSGFDSRKHAYWQCYEGGYSRHTHTNTASHNRSTYPRRHRYVRMHANSYFLLDRLLYTWWKTCLRKDDKRTRLPRVLLRGAVILRTRRCAKHGGRYDTGRYDMLKTKTKT